MKRKELKAKSVTSSNDASCINNARGMARRAKKNSNKAARKALKDDLKERIE